MYTKVTIIWNFKSYTDELLGSTKAVLPLHLHEEVFHVSLGSLDWSISCKFDSQSGRIPRLRVPSPVGGVQEAIDWCSSLTSMFLFLSLSASYLSKINKHIPKWDLKKKKEFSKSHLLWNAVKSQSHIIPIGKLDTAPPPWICECDV